jgi:hypothetical protein
MDMDHDETHRAIGRLRRATDDVLSGQDKAIADLIANKLRQCDAFKFAKQRMTPPIWCEEGHARDYALMLEAWSSRAGAMPAPRPLTLPPLHYATPEQAFVQFMGAFGETKRLVLNYRPAMQSL